MVAHLKRHQCKVLVADGRQVHVAVEVLEDAGEVDGVALDVGVWQWGESFSIHARATNHEHPIN
jgi:hypothetical protein